MSKNQLNNTRVNLFRGDDQSSKVSTKNESDSDKAEMIFNSTGRNNVKKNSNVINDKVKTNIGRFGVDASNSTADITPSDDQLARSRDYCGKKITNDLGSKFKNYQFDYCKDNSLNQQDYKARPNAASRISNQFSNFQRDNIHHAQYSRDEGKASSNGIYTAATLKTLDQQPKSAQVNFPPLRAPQSIVNVRHPFVTEARVKHNESNGLKTKSTAPQSKDTSYHKFGSSTMMSPYSRADSYPQQTLASVMFSDTSQFSQSTSSYSSSQFQTYDHPASYQTMPPPQFSDNSMSFTQYENPNFVQPSHYPATELSSNQFSYHGPSVAHPQDSPMFIQSPIAMSEQYGAPNYPRAMRTDVVHRLHRPTKFNN